MQLFRKVSGVRGSNRNVISESIFGPCADQSVSIGEPH